jgi:hypothetical protein
MIAYMNGITPRTTPDFWTISRIRIYSEDVRKAIFWKDAEKAHFWAEKLAHIVRFGLPEMFADPEAVMLPLWPAGVQYGRQLGTAKAA